jgi:hypothetical protein
VFAAEAVMELEAADADEVPTEFKAVTVKVYAVAGDKPVTEMVPELACVIVEVMPPGEEVAV